MFLVTDTKTIRENALCIHCKSCSRNRHIARNVLKTFSQYGARSLKDFADIDSVRIYNTAASGCFARVWGKQPHITYSEYFDDCERGQHKDGILCQDLQALTFEDGCFDLVISEDVLEHLRDYRKGFQEIHRVLKKAGYHIFTVPLPFSFRHKTFSRFEQKDGHLVPVLPMEYHGDPVRGQSCSFTNFDCDVLSCLEETGFEVFLNISRYDEQRKYGTFDSFVFVTRKV